MADDIEKFVLSYTVDSKRAEQMLVDLNKLIEKTGTSSKSSQSKFKDFLSGISPEFAKLNSFIGSATKGMEGFGKVGLGVGVALGGLAATMTAIGIATRMTILQMNELNRRGIAAGNLGMGQLSQEAFGRNMVRAAGGGTTAQALSMGQRLSDLVNEAARDPNPASRTNILLAQAGITTRGPGGEPISGREALNQLSITLSKMGPNQGAGLVNALGIADNPQLAAKGLAALQGNVSKLPDDLANNAQSFLDAADKARDLQNNIDKLKESFRQLEVAVGEHTIPAVNEFIKFATGGKPGGGPAGAVESPMDKFLKAIKGPLDTIIWGKRGKPVEDDRTADQRHRALLARQGQDEHKAATDLQAKEDEGYKQQQQTTDDFLLAVNLFAGAAGSFSDTVIDQKQAWAAWAGEVGAASGMKPPPGVGTSGTSVGQLNSSVSRGVRNNNPGNLEYGTFAKAHGATGSDGRFAIFPDAATGNAAMLALLQGKTYMGGGVNTISKIVSRYAPSSENDTAAYIAAVSKATGIAPGAVIQPGQLSSVQKAMAIHESGGTTADSHTSNSMRIGGNPTEPLKAMYDNAYTPDIAFGPSVNVRGGGQSQAKLRWNAFMARISSQIGISPDIIKQGGATRGDVSFALRGEQASDVKALAAAELALKNMPKNLPPQAEANMQLKLETGVRAASSRLADLMDYGSDVLGRARAGGREITRGRAIPMTINAPITIQGDGLHGPALAAHIRAEFESNLAPHLNDIVNHAADSVSY